MGKYKETSKGGFKTKKEAQLAAAKVEEQLVKGTNISNRQLTFNDYMYEWLDTYKKNNVAPQTYKIYKRNIRLYVLPTFGTVRLKDLTRLRYQQFINSLLEKRSKQTVNLIHATLQGALNTAVHELGILEKKP